MSKRTYIWLAIVAGAIGAACRIVAYHNTPPHDVPEWVYDLDSVGYALETLWPYLLSVAVCRYLPKIKLLHASKFAAVAYSYAAFFDAGKEVSGINASNSWGQVLIFWIGLILILLFQYHVYRYNTTD